MLALALSADAAGSYFLAVTYFLVALFGIRKLIVVRRISREWDSTTFFTGSLLFACVVRVLGMASICALQEYNVSTSIKSGTNIQYEPQTIVPSDQSAEFYGRALQVLFNIGDFVTVSTYLSLVVVWVETFQQSRRHYYSEQASRRNWMIAFLVFNGFVYAIQIVLYLLYFFDNSRADFLEAIYITLAVINLLVPVSLLFSLCVLLCLFSGFPFKSAADREKWHKMSRMTTLWSIMRFLYGGVAVASATGVLQKVSSTAFSMGLVTVFLLSEVAPFLFSLSSDLLTLLAYDRGFTYTVRPRMETSKEGPAHARL